jgi:hypothetical protein
MGGGRVGGTYCWKKEMSIKLATAQFAADRGSEYQLYLLALFTALIPSVRRWISFLLISFP